MGLSPQKTAELYELLWRLRAGDAAPEELARLERMVCEDPRVRAFYVRYMHLCADLFWNGSEAETERGASDSPSIDPSFVIPPLSPLPSLSTTHYPLPTAFVGGPVFSYMVATVVLCLMLLGAWAYKISHISDTQVVNNSRRSRTSGPSELVFVGKITGMKDCRWSKEGESTFLGASVSLDREYALASGLLEITYKSGARVILEGPCTYKVESSDGGYLELGKLTARIEERGEGRGKSAKPQALFSVKTPTAIVTDLGTEFGVEVDEKGDTVSYVFQGSISVQGLAASVASGATEKVLHENESIRVSRVRETHHDLETASQNQVRFTHPTTVPKFVRNISDAGLAESDRYAELVLSMRPVVYYRMERTRDDSDRRLIIDSAGGNHHGRMLSDDPGNQAYALGRWGNALEFRGPEAGDAAIVDDFPIATDDRLTVSVWVLCRRWLDSWPQIVGNWGYKAGQFHFGLFKDDYDLAVKIAQRDGEYATVREENVRFPLGVWQHVAFVVDGTEVRLYRNGFEVASAPCSGLQPDPLMKSLAIGCKTDDSGRSVWGKHWHGLIDEVALFNKALSPEEIRRLYEGMTPPVNERKEGGNQDR